MLQQLLDNSAIAALVGVLIGFVLSEGSAAYKRFNDSKSAKAALVDEVRFNHQRSKEKIDVLDQAIAALKKTRFLSIRGAYFSLTEFANLYHVALPRLDQRERDSLRHLNSFYSAIDNITSNFDDEFKNDLDNCEIRENSIDGVYEAGIVQLENLRDALDRNLAVSKALLDGNPLPVYEGREA